MSAELKKLLSEDDIYYREPDGNLNKVTMEERFDKLRNYFPQKYMVPELKHLLSVDPIYDPIYDPNNELKILSLEERLELIRIVLKFN